MIVATAGHIDHGKTALVRALTGVDTDRLPEEKARGITIDLGYAYTTTAGGQSIGFIDVPGHERLVHTMVAGMVGVDFALLLVAADDGPMPQTREHLAILDLLGVPGGIVVITKFDRVDPGRLGAVMAEVQDMVRGTVLDGAPVLACSAVTGDGMAAVRRALEQATAELPTRTITGGFRLAVDRAFSLLGVGLVATGTAHSGTVAAGQRLVLSPSGIEVRVRGLHSQNIAAEHAQAGQRIALNITGPRLEKAHAVRGTWLTDPALHAPTTRLDARLRLLPGEARALRHWTPVHVHLGAADISGRIGLLEDRALEPGGTAWVQLVLDTPTVAAYGDRFVIRDQSATRALGGGHVVDPHPPQRGARKPERRRVLVALDHADSATALRALLAEMQAGLDLEWFRRVRNVMADELPALAGAMITVGPLGFAPAHYAALQARVLTAMAEHAAAAPDSAGCGAEELLRRLPPVLRVAGRAALRDLVEAGSLQRYGPLLHLPGHEIRLTLAEESLWEEIQDVLRPAGMDQPRLGLLAERLQVKKEALLPLVQKLAGIGRLCRVSASYYVLPEALTRLARAAEAVAGDSPGAILTVGRFREATGIGRHVTMPVLEFFDKVGLTTRRVNGRVVRPGRAALFEGAGF